VLLLTDVTQTRRLQERMGRQKRLIALGQMAANLAHQIRTPLSAAILSASQFKSLKLEGPARSQKVDKLLGNLRQLETLVNDMLMFSRTGYTGEQPFSLESLLTELEKSLRQQLTANSVELNVDNRVGRATLLGNQHLLQSALQNLANNALQAMGQQGTLDINIKPAPVNGIDICVQDCGPGIQKDLQDQIFEPFFTTRSSGNGLGLAIVRAIARAHRGEVWLDSTSNQGSVFIMRLPTVH
jgi:two-component system sensor histidine kinase FlrB